MYSQHHEVKSPTHNDHQGRTIIGHTSVLRVVLLVPAQVSSHDQECLWKVTSHHADKIFLTQPTLYKLKKTLLIHLKRDNIVNIKTYHNNNEFGGVMRNIPRLLEENNRTGP